MTAVQIRDLIISAIAPKVPVEVLNDFNVNDLLTASDGRVIVTYTGSTINKGAITETFDRTFNYEVSATIRDYEHLTKAVEIIEVCIGTLNYKRIGNDKERLKCTGDRFDELVPETGIMTYKLNVSVTLTTYLSEIV